MPGGVGLRLLRSGVGAQDGGGTGTRHKSPKESQMDVRGLRVRGLPDETQRK